MVGTITICTAAYAPFVLPSAFASVNWLQVAHYLPDGLYAGPNVSQLSGYEIDIAQQVFGQELGLTVQYLFTEWMPMILALREGGFCDVAFSGIAFNAALMTCDETCPPVPPGGIDIESDYGGPLWGNSLNYTCCVDFGFADLQARVCFWCFFRVKASVGHAPRSCPGRAARR